MKILLLMLACNINAMPPKHKQSGDNRKSEDSSKNENQRNQEEDAMLDEAAKAKIAEAASSQAKTDDQIIQVATDPSTTLKDRIIKCLSKHCNNNRKNLIKIKNIANSILELPQDIANSKNSEEVITIGKKIALKLIEEMIKSEFTYLPIKEMLEQNNLLSIYKAFIISKIITSANKIIKILNIDIYEKIKTQFPIDIELRKNKTEIIELLSNLEKEHLNQLNFSNNKILSQSKEAKKDKTNLREMLEESNKILMPYIEEGLIKKISISILQGLSNTPVPTSKASNPMNIRKS